MQLHNSIANNRQEFVGSIAQRANRIGIKMSSIPLFTFFTDKVLPFFKFFLNISAVTIPILLEEVRDKAPNNLKRLINDSNLGF